MNGFYKGLFILGFIAGLNACTSEVPSPEPTPAFDCAALDCDDSNPCTDDICEGEVGCMHSSLAGSLCDDGDDQTAADRCSNLLVCEGRPIVCPSGPCIASSQANGSDCDIEYIAAAEACDDDDSSTSADVCDGAGLCAGEAIVCLANACIESAQANGVDCDYVYAAAAESCDDDDPSTRADVCDGFGVCAGEPGPCTGLDCGACGAEVQWPLPWFEGEAVGALAGRFEHGQTQITRPDETRIAPPLLAGREALLLFIPERRIDNRSDMRLALFLDDSLLGVLPMQPPTELPQYLEQGLTETQLDPYSRRAWSTFIPWNWVQEGAVLRVGHEGDEGLMVQSLTLENLGAPHLFTVNRIKMLLFGEGGESLATTPGPKHVRDFFGSVATAAMELVDSTPWVLDSIVENTAEGPRWAHSEAERLGMASRDNRYGLFRHHIAFRHSLANTGRGLSMTNEGHGNNSPYGFGTSVGMGWIRDQNGNLIDINNGGVAGGWTGWTALWNSDCGNGFIHEGGHAQTMLHFVSGTARRWGIAEEYPQDGVNLAGHPAAYDSSRRRLRTWYRVNADGPVLSDGEFVGKRDPMNGGEAANSITCFPQFTGFHARKSQAWMQRSATIREVDGEAGAFLWNAETKRYDPFEVGAAYQAPVAVGVPIITLVGTLGNLDEVCQTYPPYFAASGNVFSLPAPDAAGLHEDFTGSRWFLSLHHADGSVRHALIARGSMANTTETAMYSLNVARSAELVRVDLHRSGAAYPLIDIEGAELIHSRQIAAPAKEPAPVYKAGRGYTGNGVLHLAKRCVPGVDCDGRRASSTWRVGTARLHARSAPEDVQFCAENDTYSSYSLSVTNDEGVEAEAVVHVQRVIESQGQTRRTAGNDATPWHAAANQQQSLQAWLPFAANQHLGEGHWRGALSLTRYVDEQAMEPLRIEVSLAVHPLSEARFIDGVFSTPELRSPRDPNSSLYYNVEELSFGPTNRHWWTGPAVTLSAPVIDEQTGELKTLRIRATKEACGQTWALNTGQSNWDCQNQARLEVAPDDNPDLVAGHRYRSPGSSPLRLLARRWHAPNANAVIAAYTLRLNLLWPMN
jgi:hypothetical protein